jgi:transposase InsO family protein
VLHPRQVGQSAGFEGAAWVQWGSFSVYGVKLHLLCATNRVPLSYELTPTNLAEVGLTKELLAEADLKVPAKERKRRRMGTSENGCTRRHAEYINHVWTYDFAMDTTQDGRRLKVMPIVDEYSRECLALEVARSITAEDVLNTLARVCLMNHF